MMQPRAQCQAVLLLYAGLYSRFRVFSPDCTLHSVIAHLIKVLEQWSLK